MKLTGPFEVLPGGRAKSSDVAIATAASFAILAALVGVLSEGSWSRSSDDWRLRGTIGPTDAGWLERPHQRVMASLKGA